MKAHEEAWRAGEDVDTVYIDSLPEDRLDMRIGRGDPMARVRLAACAPEMARLLMTLGMDWVDGDPLTTSVGCCVCQCCKGEGAHAGDVKHRDNCELVALLTKAGVLP